MKLDKDDIIDLFLFWIAFIGLIAVIVGIVYFIGSAIYDYRPDTMKFSVTDVVTPKTLSFKEKQKVQRILLGSKIKIDFYPNKLRLTLTGNDDKTDEVIFDKDSDRIYKLIDNEEGIVLLEFLRYGKLINYYNKLTIKTTDSSGYLLYKITAIRE